MKDKIQAIIIFILVCWAVIFGITFIDSLFNKPKYYTTTNDQDVECGFIHVGSAGDEYRFTNIPLEYFE